MQVYSELLVCGSVFLPRATENQYGQDDVKSSPPKILRNHECEGKAKLLQEGSEVANDESDKTLRTTYQQTVHPVLDHEMKLRTHELEG